MTRQQRPLDGTGFSIAPLVLGTNVFGWTVDESTAFAILDAFVDSGFDAIDTADSYSAWAPGNVGGESETIIGRWLARDPSKRQRVHVFTKVGSAMPGNGRKKTLAKRWILRAAEDSLRRLGVDTIDLYQSHWPDPDTPHEETLAAYAELLRAGKVRAIGASNVNAAQLAEALRVADAHGLPRYQTLQPEYNLYDRGAYEGPLRDLAMREGLGVITYYGLASGFLSGKYRSRADLAKSPRGRRVERYLDERGLRILAVLDDVAARHGARPAEVALAWLMQREGVTAPIASATSLEQMASLVRAAELRLAPDDTAALDRAGA
ncbi:MAG TPA: aldo/keto reductase [Gemmatimonadaceae bacterium]|nr:aldo/keto reductase [Gemmatimonadaceae bacterium]